MIWPRSTTTISTARRSGWGNRRWRRWFSPTRSIGWRWRGRAYAAATVRDVRNDPRVTVLPQTRVDFDAALVLYEARPDKGYSLTDCRSMLAMRTLAISEVLSNDHHFTQEGFTVLFP